MKKILFIIALSATLGSGAILSTANAGNDVQPVAAITKQKTVTLNVPGMFCPTCPFTVRKSLEKLEGVSHVETSIETKTATVMYDPTKLDTDDLIKATTDVGYPSNIKEEKE